MIDAVITLILFTLVLRAKSKILLVLVLNVVPKLAS